MALDRDFRPIAVENARRVRVLNNSAAALSEGEGFKMVSGTVTALDDANTVGLYGVACADIAVSAVGECYIEGTFLVDVEGTVDFAQGQAVYTAGADSVDAGSSNDVPIGHVVGSNPASGAATVEIEIISQLKDRTAKA